jgi:hypothetical protein
MYNEQTDSSEMPSRAQGLSGLLRLTSAVAAAGIALPPEFTALKDRLVAFSREASSHAPSMMQRLVAAVRNGGDAPLWFAAAMAERGADQTERRAEVLGELHETLAAELRSMYAPVALPFYCSLAAEYDRPPRISRAALSGWTRPPTPRRWSTVTVKPWRPGGGPLWLRPDSMSWSNR